MSSHRARVPVRFPDAAVGTCKHCGRGCDPGRRTHDDCQVRQFEANDYRAAARQREGEWQRCVDCRRVFPAAQMQRDHPRELVDNGPRDWTVARCTACHQAKTQRARIARTRGSGVRVDGRTIGMWAAGAACLVLGVLWFSASPDPATWSVPDGAGVRHTVGAWLPRVLIAGTVAVLVVPAVRVVLRRRREAIERIGDAIARETHTNPDEIRLRVRHWSWEGVPTAASCRYSALFEDAPGPDRDRVETLIERKVGGSLVFTWTPHRDTVAWRPLRQGEPPQERHVALVPEQDRSGPIRGRVEEKIGGAIRGPVQVAWGDSDAVGPTRFEVTYPSTYNDESPETRQALVDAVNSKAPGRWKATWSTEENRVRFDRRPPMPGMIPNPVATEVDAWRLPFGRDEHGAEVAWSLRTAPHCLIVGGTGSGKTVTIRSIVTDACARGFTVFCVDPKRIELTGLRDWPGVRAVASSIEEMIALVTMIADEMDARYAAIEAGTITEDDLPPLLLVMDEVREWIQRANAWWKSNRPKGASGTEHPVIERWRSMARLGRSGRVHLVVGIQRPDASVFGGEARDNYGFRVALGPLSQEGARMVFGRADVARDVPPEAKGRATVMTGEREPLEVQTYYTPNPRNPEGPGEVQHLGALRAAADGTASDAVAQINPGEIAAFARRLADDPAARWAEVPTGVAPSAPRSNSEGVAVGAWEPVDLDDLTPGDTIRVDLDGAPIAAEYVGAVEVDDGVEVEVSPLGQPNLNSTRLVWVGPDDTVERLLT